MSFPDLRLLRWLDAESKMIQMVICYPALVIPSSLPNQVNFLKFPKHLQSQMKHGLRKQYIILEC